MEKVIIKYSPRKPTYVSVCLRHDRSGIYSVKEKKLGGLF